MGHRDRGQWGVRGSDCGLLGMGVDISRGCGFAVSRPSRLQATPTEA